MATNQTTPQDDPLLKELADPKASVETARRLGLKDDAVRGCLERGASYGAQASGMLASFGIVEPSTLGIAFAVGGLYGCSKKGGFQKVGGEISRNWKKASKGLRKAEAWVGDLVNGRLFTKERKGKRKTPPTADEAMSITAAFFAREGGHKRVFDVGHRWLTPQVLADIYGPDSAAWDWRQVAQLWWSLWQRSVELAPKWSNHYRMLHVMLRTGDFLENAEASATIQDWPVMVKEGSQPVAKAEEKSVPVEIDDKDDGTVMEWVMGMFGWGGEV